MKSRRSLLTLGTLAAIVVASAILLWPSASPTTATSADSITSPDTGANAGLSTSLAVDASGNPVVSYYGSGSLKVLHCNDADCSGGDDSITFPDTAGVVGLHTSLALDDSGNPVVSYYDDSNDDLKVLHCNDPNCSGGDDSITFPDGVGRVGQYTSLALDGSGHPVVSYYDLANDDLKVLHCNDPNCSGGDESIASPDTVGDVGLFTSLALDASGNPVVSYQDTTNDDLKVLHCNDPNCSGGDESITSPDTGSNVGRWTSLALDANGYPVISYHDESNGDLNVLHCNDPNCAGGDESIALADTVGTVGFWSSLALDASSNPVVSYYGYTNQDLKVLHCNDDDCAGGDDSITSPDAGLGTGGGYTSLVLDASGYPVVSYYDDTNQDLKVLHCTSATCSDAKTPPVPTVTSTPTITPTPTVTGTPTPCPTEGCPTATTTPTPTRYPELVNFSIAAGDCDTTRGYDKCYIPVNTDFTVEVSLDDISGLPNGAYSALGFTVAYEGVISNGSPTLYWPDCMFGAPKSGPGFEGYGCAIGIGEPSSTYTGVIGTVSFGCWNDGSVNLIHGNPNTFLIDDKESSIEEGGPDVLFIKCGDGTPGPTATPLPPKDPDADTDGDTVANSADLDDDNDGCPDEAENGINEMQGGRRDPHNRWDYFNPTNDGKNRVDDILTLVNHYYLAEGDPGYDEKYDRTAIPETAKEPWRLGPPSGQILVDDILHMLGSYRHDCGTGIE